MCSLFGLIDYQNALTTRQKNRILQVLGKECEVRGTDATGIAYNFGDSIKVFKRPLAIFDFGGFYLYASTEEILRRTMRKLRPHHRDILKIERAGQRSFAHFNPNRSFQHFWRNPRLRMLSWFDEVDEIRRR